MNTKLKNPNQVSPIDSLILDLVAAYLVLTFLLCVTINSALLYVFARYPKIRTSYNKLIMVMTAFNLFGSVQFPFVIHSHFVYKFVYILILLNFNSIMSFI